MFKHTLGPTGFFSTAVKRGPGREFDHSPPSTANVKNEWSYTSTLAIGLHGIEGDSFTSTGHKTLSVLKSVPFQGILRIHIMPSFEGGGMRK